LAVLLLCHPTLAVYSRTLMADGGAGLGLLLAALAVATTGRPFMGAWAGAAVAARALMRYHTGLALPFVAAAFRFPPVRPRPLREAFLCLLTGGLGGGLVVAYNMWLYHHPTDPNPSVRGLWSPAFVVPQAKFYAAALMAIWPGMLLAPLLDRSTLRWMVRGVCGLYTAMFLLYYWHDTGSDWLETAVVGQRLIQVALPLWVVSYAGVLDDWVVAPLRRRAGDPVLAGVAAVICLGLLAGDGLMFRKHQQHLNRLLSAREAAVAVIPPGSLVVDHGPLRKLFGVPVGVPSYRWHPLAFGDNTLVRPGDEVIARERSPWYLAVLERNEGQPFPEPAQALIDHYHMVKVPTRDPRLTVYVSGGETGRRPPGVEMVPRDPTGAWFSNPVSSPTAAVGG
jgi:hypothetical protein